MILPDNYETSSKNVTNYTALTMQHMPALATLQLVAVHKALKYSAQVLTAAQCMFIHM